MCSKNRKDGCCKQDVENRVRLTLTSQDSGGFDNHLQFLVPGECPDVICRKEKKEKHCTDATTNITDET